MKASTSILIASTIAFASTIYAARPAFLKRAENVAEAIACLTPIFLNPMNLGSIALSECQSKLSQDIGLVKSTSVNHMEFDLRGEFPTIASNDIKVELMSLLRLPSLPVSRARLQMIIMDGTTVIGTSSSKWSPTRTDGFSLEMGYPATPLIITEEQRPAYIALLAALATGGSRTILITGKADVELSISITDALSVIPNPFGFKAPTVATKIIPLLGVGISAPITLKGMHNFGGVVHGNLDTLSTIQISATGERSIRGQIVIISPTDVLAHLGDVNLQVWSKDAQPEFLGIATVENLSLAPGAETYNFILKIDAAIQVDKYYPVKAGLTVSANGFAGSSKNVIVNGVVAAIKFDIVF